MRGVYTHLRTMRGVYTHRYEARREGIPTVMRLGERGYPPWYILPYHGTTYPPWYIYLSYHTLGTPLSPVLGDTAATVDG